MRQSDKKALDGGRTGAPLWMPQPLPAASLRGRCGDCATVWVVAVLPKNLSAHGRHAAIAHVRHAACPKCACTKVFVDTQPSPTVYTQPSPTVDTQPSPTVESQPAGEVKHG